MKCKYDTSEITKILIIRQIRLRFVLNPKWRHINSKQGLQFYTVYQHFLLFLLSCTHSTVQVLPVVMSIVLS